jgi:hypothetical protein
MNAQNSFTNVFHSPTTVFNSLPNVFALELDTKPAFARVAEPNRARNTTRNQSFHRGAQFLMTSSSPAEAGNEASFPEMFNRAGIRARCAMTHPAWRHPSPVPTQHSLFQGDGSLGEKQATSSSSSKKRGTTRMALESLAFFVELWRHKR